MLRPRFPRLLLVFLPTLLLVLTATALARSGAARPATLPSAAGGTAAPTGTQPALAQDLDQQLYLPLVVRAPVTIVEFAATVDLETGEPINPATDFDAGLDLLWVSVRLQGYAGRSMRLDFAYADGETLTGRPRSVDGDEFRFTTAYCITTDFTCDSGRLPLPVGDYTARVFIDGLQVHEAVATIR